MATRFAVASTNWNTPSTWDNGAVPVAGDTVYPNSFTVTIDQDINVASLNNNISPITLPSLTTPAMTSNTQPTGTVISSNNSGTAYNAFNQDGLQTTYWNSGINNTGWLGYTFGTSKVIKRYYFNIYNSTNNPKTWTFEGSNDGFATAGVQLDIVASYTTNAPYTSGLLANTTAYTSYRINVTATQGANTVIISELELSDSINASPVYGRIGGGSFTVPSSLSGTRNIVQSGAGMITNNSATIMTIAALTGNTVNFNITSGGYIVNPFYRGSVNMTNPVINITGTSAVNFNSDLWGCQTASNTYSTGGVVGINAAATITVNGNIYADKGTDGAPTYYAAVLQMTSINCIVNVIGTVNASDFKAYAYPIVSTAANTLNVTGNVTGNISNAIFSNITGFTCNITGNITTTNVNSQPAICLTPTLNTSLLTINGSIINKNNINSIYANRIRFTANTNPYWIFQNTAGADITLSYGSATGAYPAEADVKLGVTYAASPTRTGTCAVPLPTYVSQGVATGSTIGTAYLNAADVWNILTSTITVSGSIGERLKNASTVQTTGDQIASYQV